MRLLIAFVARKDQDQDVHGPMSIFGYPHRYLHFARYGARER